MPHEAVVAIFLIILVLLVPVLKWAKDRMMKNDELIPVGKVSIPKSAIESPGALQQFLGGEDQFLDWVWEMEPNFGDIPDYALSIERHYQRIVNGRVDQLYGAFDAFLKLDRFDGDAYAKVADLFRKVSKYLSIGGLCAASAKMRKVKSHLRDLSLRAVGLPNVRKPDSH